MDTHKTIILKLSGEALGNKESKYSEQVLEKIVGKVLMLLSDGIRVGLVIGGGNLFRGKDLRGVLEIQHGTADYIGMLATVQNALVVRDYFESKGVPTRVLSSMNMPQICEPYIPQRAVRHMEKGRVVIFAAGLGVPFFTTDTTSVQRALEMKAEMLVMVKNGVDGLYTGDPKTDSSATKISTMSASEVLEKGLRVADGAAMALAKENGLAIKIIGLDDINRAASKDVGSYIDPR